MLDSFSLLSFGVALCALIRLADWKAGVMGVCAVSVVCMVAIAAFADIPITIFGLRSNFGNLLYAPVIFGTALCVIRHGADSAWRQVRCVFIGMVASMAVTHGLTYLPMAAPNLGDSSLRVIGPSFLAFVLGNSAAIASLRLHNSGVLAQIAGQFVDSIVFFPLAFGGVNGFPLWETMAGGFAMKAALACMTWPMFCRLPQRACGVLYVDDEPKARKYFHSLFGQEFKVFTAGSPEEGMELLGKENICVVLADQRMPSKSGADFLGEVAKHHPRTTRVLVSAYSDFHAVVDAINKGRISSYVTKPYEIEGMQKLLASAVH